ncbi:MAG: hypothetical protein FIA95_10070, partial [Gemmatimonadetes bacterium]|nr:hypothetical protein [Gemmatimonadota bacterium]
MAASRTSLVRGLAHGAGAAGAALAGLLLVGLTVPPAERFPDSRLAAFHTFFVGTLVETKGLPEANNPDWMSSVEPGDALFLSRGRGAGGEWSHVAVVVRAPADA